VFSARYALSPYIKQIRFVFKGVMIQFVLRSKHTPFVLKTPAVIALQGQVAVCSEIHTKHMHAVCGQNGDYRVEQFRDLSSVEEPLQ
jgi:hypothetical protein